MNLADLVSELERCAVYLRLTGANDFKCAAYEKASRAIENDPDEIAEHLKSKTLIEVSGIGKSLAAEIYAWAESGSLPKLEALKEAVPAELVKWLKISGLGPKTIYKIHKALEITTLDELVEKLEDGSVAALPGQGAKSAEKILKSISFLQKHSERCMVSEATVIAEAFYAALESHPAVKRISIAGSLRRQQETIGDIDLLVAAETDQAEALFELLVAQEAVTETIARGDTKCSVRTEHGRQVDLRIVAESQFEAALLYFTGSKDHNVILRQRARDKNWALNEYGLYAQNSDGDTDFDAPINAQTEVEIYQKLDLPFIPPELREGRGEDTYSEPPELLELSDIKGVLHAHSTWSDGRNSIREMAQACIDLGYEYLGLTDHSKTASYAGGLTIKRVKEQWAEIEQINSEFADQGIPFKVFKGIESDILADGSLDYPNDILAGFDFIVASVHAQQDMGPEQMTERLETALRNPYTTMLGHPTGRLLLTREGSKPDLNHLMKVAIECDTVIEINANPRRLDLDWRLGREGAKNGLMTSINPDAHTTAGIQDIRYGVGVARKAAFAKAQVVNTQTVQEFEKWLEH